MIFPLGARKVVGKAGPDAALATVVGMKETLLVIVMGGTTLVTIVGAMRLVIVVAGMTLVMMVSGTKLETMVPIVVGTTLETTTVVGSPSKVEVNGTETVTTSPEESDVIWRAILLLTSTFKARLCEYISG